MLFDEVAQDIAKRQYMQPDEESVEEVFERAARTIASVDENPDEMYEIMRELMLAKIFCPGGRILAGADTEHGNLLNCFVQDGSPEAPGTTAWVMNLAKKLALVTKVGGGNGVNLDPIPPKSDNPDHVGRVFVTIRDDHPDQLAVKNGTYLDLVTGERTTFGYQNATFVPYEFAPYENVIEVPDDTAGIWDAAYQMVQQQRLGNDVLIDVSALRPEGTPVKGSGGESSGPASFAVEVFDNFSRWANLGAADHAGPVATLRYVLAPTLRVIRQGGTRRGAGMATISAEHPDVIDFIRAKDLEREKNEGGIGTFNMSVLLTDDFMDAAEEENTTSNDVFRLIAHHAWATGEPGVIFVDTINEYNPLKNTDGPILATNPCGEIPLYPGEPCDLAAINLSELVLNGEFLWGKFRSSIRWGVRALDNVLTAEKSPLPSIMEAIQDKRRIGLGLMGLGDALIKMQIPYGSMEAQDFAYEIAEVMADVAVDESEKLGSLRGVPAGVERAGLSRRNIALLTVAPTGTTAMLFGVTSGIEPLFSPMIYRRVGSDYVEILHPLFKEIMEAHGWNEQDWPALKRAISDNHGSVIGLPHVPHEVQEYFLTAHDVNPNEHIMMQASVQTGFDSWLDSPDRGFAGNSISKTINLPGEADISDVEHAFRQAWHYGAKGCTVYRNGSRGLQVLNTSSQDDEDHAVDEALDPYCRLDGTCDA